MAIHQHLVALALSLLCVVAASRHALAQHDAAAQQQCRSCPLSATAPVCDADGIMYPNDCVARCQGVADFTACAPMAAVSSSLDAAEGAGSGRLGAGQFLPESRRVTEGQVTWEVMNQLADQGFRFLGQFEFLEGAPDVQVEHLEEDQDPSNPGASSGAILAERADDAQAEDSHQQQQQQQQQQQRDDEGGRQVHVTYPEGYAYVRTTATQKPSTTTTSLPPNQLGSRRRSLLSARRHLRTHSGVSGRKLHAVFAPDLRTFRDPATEGYPAQSILWLRFQNATGSGFMCSGSMISSYAFLTAGHCVFTTGVDGGAHKNFLLYSGSPDPDGYVPPKRLALDGVNVTVRSVRSLTGWTSSGKFPYDVAILTLNQPVGDRLGWLGVRHDDCQSIQEVEPINTWGYPGDKPKGTQWGMGGCSVRSVDSEAASTCALVGIFRHDCDTYAGQSGSPIYDDDLYVHGVVSFAQSNRFNGSPWLGGVVWDMVLGVVESTRTTSLTSDSDTGSSSISGSNGTTSIAPAPPPPVAGNITATNSPSTIVP